MARRLTGIGLVGLLALAPIGGVRAESYRWVDEDGVVHYTDDPYQLPEPQRSKVIEKLEKEGAAEKKRAGGRSGRDRSGATDWYRPLPEGAVAASAAACCSSHPSQGTAVDAPTLLYSASGST